ncbi:MAG: hypothetical protein JW840_09180 [Candidatus Thermoplasmatota archaeon]|nr:hypothetical protein [Candidatus Thermoplasmatota archaeon]
MKHFFTCEESREGLQLLANDIRNWAKKPHPIKFGFADVLKIILVTALCGFGIALGFWIFGIVISL